MNIAVIIAGGTGSRLNCNIPKQFITVDDKPIIIYTLEKFQKNKNIDMILVVILDKWQEVLQAYAQEYKISKLKVIITGGSSNQDSINKAINHLESICKNDDIIMIHAANRPMVTNKIINDGLEICKNYGNSVTAIKCIEVAFVSENNLVEYEVDRNNLYRTQTPQTFFYEDLHNAYKKANEMGVTNKGTAAALLLSQGENIHLVKGTPLNFKITTSEDLIMFKALQRYEMEQEDD